MSFSQGLTLCWGGGEGKRERERREVISPHRDIVASPPDGYVTVVLGAEMTIEIHPPLFPSPLSLFKREGWMPQGT